MTEKEGKYSDFRIAVPKDYGTVFSHFYFAENTTGSTVAKTLLPTYQSILIFNFGAKAILNSKQNTEVKIDKCLVLGPITQAFDYALPPKSEILVANFKEDAFFRFFGDPAGLGRLPIHPDELLKENCFTALWNELNKIKGTNHRVNYILEFCRPYLGRRNPVVEQLVTFESETLNPIKSIAGRFQQSERSMQIKHKKHLGYTAKEIMRFQRFIKSIEHIQDAVSRSAKIDWIEIISQCGYYDQSQLIKDFKHYINLTPTKYIRFHQDICNPKAE